MEIWKNVKLWRFIFFASFATLIFSNWMDASNSTKTDLLEPNSGQLIDGFNSNQLNSKRELDPLAKPGYRAALRPEIDTEKIKAYLISSDEKRQGFIRAKAELERCGFHVIRVEPMKGNEPFIMNMVYKTHQGQNNAFAHKYTIRMIWDWIASDPTLDKMTIPFSLIFEEGVQLNKLVEAEKVIDIVQNVANLTASQAFSGMFYLGMNHFSDPICDGSGKYEKKIDGVGYNVCNGRGFFATGYLKYEGKWLWDRIDRLVDLPENSADLGYMDSLVHKAFNPKHEMWPYLAGFDLQDPSIRRTVRGIFYQTNALS